jgi:hypothetical protein
MGLSLQLTSVDRSLSGCYRGNHDNFGLRCVWRAWGTSFRASFWKKKHGCRKGSQIGEKPVVRWFRGAPSLALAKIRPVLFVDGSFLSSGMKAWVKPDHLDVAPRRIRDPVYLRVRARTSLLGLQITIALFVSILKIRAFRPVRGTFPDRPAQTA